jgi:voltage-gated potassium channel
MDERSERIARRFDAPMLVAALLVVPVVAVEQSSLAEPWTTLASILNWMILLAFASEVVAMHSRLPGYVTWRSSLV